MSRKLAREKILKYLFSMDFNKDKIFEDMMKDYFDKDGDPEDNEIFQLDIVLNEKDSDFCEEIFKGVVENLSAIDELIQDNSISWKKHRMAKVDLAILRLAVYEILYRDDIPDSVSANEAIELAKKYSSDDASKFVNGILGNIIKNK